MNFTPKDKKEPKKKLTEAEMLEIRKAKAAERDKDLATAAALEKKLPLMSDRQLRNELKRVVRGEKISKKEYRAGLRVTFASILLTVFDNTKTETNSKGRLHAYPL